jgi:hypothetical protein
MLVRNSEFVTVARKTLSMGRARPSMAMVLLATCDMLGERIAHP